MDEKLEKFKCRHCNKTLAFIYKGKYKDEIRIKCPRCKQENILIFIKENIKHLTTPS